MSRPIPTRQAACLLLQQIGYDFSQLAPEERGRIRALFHLDDPRTMEQRIRADSPEVLKPRGRRQP